MTTNADRTKFNPVHSIRAGLPADITPFIGRREELNRLKALLTDPEIRLVTLLGAGGIGKTRIARELAATLQERFREGVRFISLAQLNTRDSLIFAIAAAFDIHLPLGGNLQQALLDELSSKQLLLVLDNFEDLVEEALFVRDILVAAEQIKILITSREKLNIQGEVLYPLHGLGLPPQDEPDQVETYDAIRLFLQRARQAQPDFVIREQDLLSIVHICRSVDGMPLGILLAAAWMEHFSPQAIASQIDRDLDFLAHEIRDMPVRHRSLRTVFNSSFDHLEADQRSIFPRLAVFRGGFSVQAAKVVAGADLKMLLSLVERSLLQHDIDSGRFDLHELLRQYAGERLVESGECERVKGLHAGYYLDFAHQLAPRLKSPSQAEALDAIQADFENIGQAWEWAIKHRDFNAIELATPSLYAFCDMRSRYGEGKALFGLARRELSFPSSGIPCPTRALLLLSWYDLIPYAERAAVFEELTAEAQNYLRQARAEAHAEGMAVSLILLGALVGDREDLNTAIRYYREAMEQYPPLDDFYWVNMRVGLCYQVLEQYAAAIQSFEQSLARGQALGERAKMGWSLLNIGNTLIMNNEQANAKTYLQKALVLFEELGTSVGILWVNYSLSSLALTDGDLGSAKKLATKTLELARQVHSPLWIEKVSGLIRQIEAQPAGVQPLQEPLSERELEVLRLLKSDLDGPEIARHLFVTLNTVRYHTKNIYRKLQVNNRREAVRRAKDIGL
ncbi:MAG TPA: LuxR C-terminal-related transcriptional regulator [Anaerolineales bacterium]|nr:LuxR C-terminal-related transcriptional regulator [Anaerolineales bacterium]